MKKILIALLFSACAFAQTTVTGTASPVVKSFNATAQSASIASGSGLSFFSSSGGQYRATCYTVLTQAATTSSTLPDCRFTYSDPDYGNNLTGLILNTNASNTTGTVGSIATGWQTVLNVKAGTTINVYTNGYLSSGATPMLYAVHMRLEYLGN